MNTLTGPLLPAGGGVGAGCVIGGGWLPRPGQQKVNCRPGLYLEGSPPNASITSSAPSAVIFGMALVQAGSLPGGMLTSSAAQRGFQVPVQAHQMPGLRVETLQHMRRHRARRVRLVAVAMPGDRRQHV